MSHKRKPKKPIRDYETEVVREPDPLVKGRFTLAFLGGRKFLFEFDVTEETPDDGATTT